MRKPTTKARKTKTTATVVHTTVAVKPVAPGLTGTAPHGPQSVRLKPDEAFPEPRKSPVEVLMELGEELHGAHWIGPTSRDLDIKHSTMANWVSGKSRLRDGPILDALRLLVKSHTQAVARARELAKRNVT